MTPRLRSRTSGALVSGPAVADGERPASLTWAQVRVAFPISSSQALQAQVWLSKRSAKQLTQIFYCCDLYRLYLSMAISNPTTAKTALSLNPDHSCKASKQGAELCCRYAVVCAFSLSLRDGLVTENFLRSLRSANAYPCRQDNNFRTGSRGHRLPQYQFGRVGECAKLA